MKCLIWKINQRNLDTSSVLNAPTSVSKGVIMTHFHSCFHTVHRAVKTDSNRWRRRTLLSTHPIDTYRHNTAMAGVDRAPVPDMDAVSIVRPVMGLILNEPCGVSVSWSRRRGSLWCVHGMYVGCGGILSCVYVRTAKRRTDH